MLSFQQLEDKLLSLFARTVNFHGRRIINAGRAVHAKDYMIQDQLNEIPALDINKVKLNPIRIIQGTQNGKYVIAYDNAGTITYLSIPLDGVTTTWTHSTVVP